MSTANITHEKLSNAINLLRALGNRLNKLTPTPASHLRDGDSQICAQACDVLKAIRYDASPCGSIPETIQSLEDLGQRLEIAEALSESYIQSKDWFVCTHAAMILRAISNGFKRIEPPYLIGFDEAASGSEQTVQVVV